MVALVDLTIELVMFLYEVYRLHQLDKQSVDVVVRYSETKRREVFHKKYFKIAMAMLTASFIGILIMSMTLPQKDCLKKQGLLFSKVC
jgi:hypothetical protein